MSKLSKYILKKYGKSKWFKFLQCNFRIFVTAAVVSFIAILYFIMYNLKILSDLSHNLRFSVIFAGSLFFFLTLIILKTIRDFLAIKLLNKGQGSIIEKTKNK